MKIACVQTFPIDYCIDYVNAIASLGDITFFAAESAMQNHVEFVDPAVETVLLSWPRHRSPGNLGLIYRLRQEILTRNPDVVHFLGDGVSWLSIMPSLVGQRPVLVTVHDVLKHPGDTKTLKIPYVASDLFQRLASRLVVHGQSIKDLLVERTKRPPGDLDIVPHPALLRYAVVARREALPPRSTDGRFRLLFFGRVMTYKGLPHLLDAFEMLSSNDRTLELTIAGRGPGYDEVDTRLDSPRINVHRGFVEEADVARMFLQADLVVLPYIEASQSGILAMAAAFGRAVLVTDIGELGDITSRTGMGMIVPPADGEALAKAIVTIRGDPALKAEFEAKSAEAAETGALSFGEVAKAAEQAYMRALKGYQSNTQSKAS